MLTESQFKVLMMLLDDKGHAGWELAEGLGMEESNLNPPLKKLEDRGFLITYKFPIRYEAQSTIHPFSALKTLNFLD